MQPWGEVMEYPCEYFDEENKQCVRCKRRGFRNPLMERYVCYTVSKTKRKRSRSLRLSFEREEKLCEIMGADNYHRRRRLLGRIPDTVTLDSDVFNGI